MKGDKTRYFLASILIAGILAIIGTPWYGIVSITGFLLYFHYFLSAFGQRVIIFELTALLAILTWLVVPLVFYAYFNIDNELARLWDKYMRVPPNEYYSFVIPATAVMVIGLHLPFANRYLLKYPVDTFRRVKDFLRNKAVVGFILIIIGLVFTAFTPFIPNSLRFIAYLFEHLSFVGLLYLYFSRIPLRRLFLLIGVFALLIQSISSAMFGELVFITFLSASVIYSTSKMTMARKYGLLISALILVFLLQSIKHEYRAVAWEKGASPVFFARAIGNKISNPEQLLDPYALFVLASRANQGWLIARTMYHVPRDYPYANGETIAKSFAAVLIPRFLWPGKPESGGRENLKRFWGMDIKGYSMNIGPIGEAYANFGKYGGVAFMFFYGVLLNVFLSIILGVMRRYPSLILWFPILFLYPIGTETDILSTLNPLFKISVFIACLFLFLPRVLAVRLG